MKTVIVKIHRKGSLGEGLYEKWQRRAEVEVQSYETVIDIPEIS